MKKTSLFAHANALFDVIPFIVQENYKHVFIIISRSVKKTEYIVTFIKELKKYIRVHEYTDIEKDPSDDGMQKAASTCRQYQCDIILAIGGGSVLDSAKAVSFLSNEEDQLLDYHHQRPHHKTIQIQLPCIMAPTTAGSGSEVSASIVIKNNVTKQKFRIIDQALQSSCIIYDPILLKTLPRRLLLAGALDSFAHALEGVSNKRNLYEPNLKLQEHAFEALRLLTHALPIAYENPHDEDALLQLQWAANHAGHCMKYDLNACHVFAGSIHQLRPSLHHGEAVALVLPYVAVLNEVFCQEIYSYLAPAIVYYPLGNTKELSKQFLNALIVFFHKYTQIDKKDINFTVEECQTLVDQMSYTNLNQGNPYEVTKADIEKICIDIRKQYAK